MGVVISSCATTRGGAAKATRGLNSGCLLSLETFQMNYSFRLESGGESVTG